MKISQFVGAVAITALSLGQSCNKIEKPIQNASKNAVSNVISNKALRANFIDSLCITSSERLRDWDEFNKLLSCKTYKYVPNTDSVVSLDDLLMFDQVGEVPASKIVNNLIFKEPIYKTRFPIIPKTKFPLIAKTSNTSGEVETDSIKLKFYKLVLDSNSYKKTIEFVDSLCNLSPKKYAQFIKDKLRSKQEIVKLPVTDTFEITHFTRYVDEGVQHYLNNAAPLSYPKDRCPCHRYDKYLEIQPVAKKIDNGMVETTYYGLKTEE